MNDRASSNPGDVAVASPNASPGDADKAVRPSFLDQYKERCLAVLMKRIAEGTRFGAADLEIVSASPAAAVVRLFGSYMIKVSGPVNETGGHAIPSWSDIEADSSQRFDEAHWQLIDEYQQTTSRYETLRRALGRPRDQGYLAYPHATKHTVERYDREVVYERGCATCSGDGRHTCRACHGYGRYSCNSCGGNGSLTCRWCGGSGQGICNFCNGMGSSQCETSVDHNGQHNTSWVTHSCGYCGGSGRNSCSTCGGSGSNYCDYCGGSGVYTCSACAGGGRETCIDCAGVGSLVRTGSIEAQLEASFRYVFEVSLPVWVKEILAPLAGHASLAPLGLVETLKVEVGDGAKEARAEFRAYIPYAEISVRIGSRECVVRMLGMNPALHDMGTLFQDTLLPDLDALRAAMGGWHLLNPLYHGRAGRVIRTFLESEINQKMVPCLVGCSYGNIVTELSGAIDEDYVKTSDLRLRKLLRRSAAWGRLRWTMTIALMTPVSILAVLWVIESGKVHKMLVTQKSLVLLSTDRAALIGLTAIVLAWACSAVARRRAACWIERIGGKLLARLAENENIYPGKGTTLFNMTIALLCGFAVVSTNPLSLDRQGRLYGPYTSFGFLPPMLVQPLSPKPTARTKAKKQSVEK